MTVISLLEKLHVHAFEMIKFGETKNTTLIAFNGAIIIGMVKLASDTHNCIAYFYALYVIVVCIISVFICLSAMVAKIKNDSHNIFLPSSDSILFFATLAHLKPEKLLEEMKTRYECTSENENYEREMADRAIIMSQIASRKFKLFNIAMAFTFSGIATPASVIIYICFLDHDK